MLHIATQNLILKLAEMTRQQKLVWSETSNGVFRYETEGYQVHVTQNPIELLLTDLAGREIERADSQELAGSETEAGESFTRVVSGLRKEVARQVRGTDAAIASILAGLDLDGGSAPMLSEAEADLDADEVVETFAAVETTEVEAVEVAIVETETVEDTVEALDETTDILDFSETEEVSQGAEAVAFSEPLETVDAVETVETVETVEAVETDVVVEASAPVEIETPETDVPDVAAVAQDPEPVDAAQEEADNETVFGATQLAAAGAATIAAAAIATGFGESARDEDEHVAPESITDDTATPFHISGISETADLVEADAPVGESPVSGFGLGLAAPLNEAQPTLASEPDSVVEVEVAVEAAPEDASGHSAAYNPFGAIADLASETVETDFEATEEPADVVTADDVAETQDGFQAVSASVSSGNTEAFESVVFKNTLSETRFAVQQDAVESVEDTVSNIAVAVQDNITAMDEKNAAAGADIAATTEAVMDTYGTGDSNAFAQEAVALVADTADTATSVVADSVAEVAEPMQAFGGSLAEVVDTGETAASEFSDSLTDEGTDIVEAVATNIFGDRQPKLGEEITPEALATDADVSDDDSAATMTAKQAYEQYNPWS